MAYLIEHEWEKGQTITAEKLNHMEKGIAAAIGAIENAFGKTYTDGANEYKVSLETLGSDRPITAGAITGTTLKATDTESESALDIAGASTLKGDVNIGGALTVGKNENGKTKDTTLNGKLSVNGQLTATGISNLEGGLNVGTASISKDTTMHGELTVEGATKAIAWDENNNVTSSAKKAATLNGLVNITGDSTINGDLTVGSSQNRATIKLNDAMTVKFSNNKNQIIIDGYTKINESFQIGDENNNKMAYIYGSLNIMEFNSLTHRPTASITLSKDTRITAETLTVNTGTTTLRGTTTIDKLTKLIVGDSTSTADNEIYGFTTINNLAVGAPNADSGETQTYSGTVTFNTSNIIFNQPASFFNNNISTEHMEITSRSIKQSIGDQTYDLILQNGTDIYFGASTNNTFIRGNSVTIVENDLRFTMHNNTDTYTYCFADNGQGGFKLTANYDSSDSSPQPNHTLFHYIPSAFDDDMLIVGGLSNSVASTDTSLVQDVFINAKDSIILTTKNTTGIRINNNTAITGTLKIQKIQTTVYDNSTTDGKQGYKYNYTLSASSNLGILNLLCEGVDNSNQSLTKSPVLFSYRPYGFESESYLTIGGPSLTPSNGDNKCVENMYIKAKENITLSPTSSTGKVTVKSDLHIDGKKSLYMQNTVLSEMDIIHLHTLWNNYQTQNGGE